MQTESFLKCSCKNCGGHIEFPPNASGQTVECPHCGWETELRLERKPESRAAKRKSFFAAVLISLALIGALAAGILAARKESASPKLQEEPVKTPEPVAPKPVSIKEFAPGKITIETAGGRLIYAVGTLRNETKRQRFGVKLRLNLVNANGKEIGVASDYAQVIEPNGEWRFKALVTDPKTTRAEIAGIEEN